MILNFILDSFKSEVINYMKNNKSGYFLICLSLALSPSLFSLDQDLLHLNRGGARRYTNKLGRGSTLL